MMFAHRYLKMVGKYFSSLQILQSKFGAISNRTYSKSAQFFGAGVVSLFPMFLVAGAVQSHTQIWVQIALCVFACALIMGHKLAKFIKTSGFIFSICVKSAIFSAVMLSEGVNAFVILALCAEILMLNISNMPHAHKFAVNFGYCIVTAIATFGVQKIGAPYVASYAIAGLNCSIALYIVFNSLLEMRETGNVVKNTVGWVLKLNQDGKVTSNVAEANVPISIDARVLSAVRNLPEFLACFSTESVHILRLGLRSAQTQNAPTCVIAVPYGHTTPVMIEIAPYAKKEIHIYLHEVKPFEVNNTQNLCNVHNLVANTPSASFISGGENVVSEMGRSVLSHTTIANSSVLRSRTRSSIAM